MDGSSEFVCVNCKSGRIEWFYRLIIRTKCSSQHYLHLTQIWIRSPTALGSHMSIRASSFELGDSNEGRNHPESVVFSYNGP